MIGRTHLAVGIAAGIAVSQELSTLNMPLLITTSALGSLLPDICHSNSKIGRKFPLVSTFIHFMFGHRTLTHSLFFLLMVTMSVSLITQSTSITIGILIGMATHLILDFLTKAGISLFWPLSIKVRNFWTVKTGGWIDKLIFYCAISYIIYQLKDQIISYFS